MGLPDNSWSPLVLCDFSFSFLQLRLALKWQSLLECFGDMQLIEMFLFPHNNLKSANVNLNSHTAIVLYGTALPYLFIILCLNACKKWNEELFI